MPLIESNRSLKYCSKISASTDSGCAPYDKFKEIDRIDYAIYEAEKEMQDGSDAVFAETVFEELENKY